MLDPLDGLNDQQREIVQTTQGPLLVLAGAGSGKTRALTHRIAYLMQKRLASPHQILAVTFTNKAAGEMRARVQKLLAGSHSLPKAIGTFHAIGAQILREQHAATSRSQAFQILDEKDSLHLVKQALDRVGIPREQALWVRHEISRAKNESRPPHDEDVGAAYEQYQKFLASHNAFDFDDLLQVPVHLFQKNPAVQAVYQHRWRYLSVDEYQDTNPIQVQFIELLLGPEKNLCVVGDDYQAIYSWRGASVDHILRFHERFSTAATLYLTQNYRSTPEVLESANAVIAANRAQKHKKLWTLRETQSKPVHLMAHPSDRSEAMWVKEKIHKHVAGGGNLSDCAVLYRTNAQSRVFEEEFLRAEIPYLIVGGFRFYERREIKDALALLQLSLNGNSPLALARIAQALWRGVGPKTLARWGEGVIPRRPDVQKTLRVLRGAAQKSFPAVSDRLRYLVKQSGYEAWLAGRVDAEERQENLEELYNVASVYKDSSEFLQAVALLTDLDSGKTSDRVMCLTLHAAKGLEFPVVFIVGCEEGLLPHVNSQENQAQLEEERRLLYVGMTRAKEQLSLSYAQSRYLHGSFRVSLPSRFLQTLPESVEYYETGELD